MSRNVRRSRPPSRVHVGGRALPRAPLPSETDILAQIELSLDVLRGRIAPDPGAVAGLSAEANAAVRICWLLHLVGDLHQPTRLHACWDGMVGAESRFDVCRLAEELTHDPALVPTRLPELTNHREPREWAAESYPLAKTHIYRDGHFALVRWADVENRTVSAADVPALSEHTASEARKLARRRVTLAGHRLATLLAERP